MAKFKTLQASQPTPESPTLLFRDLKRHPNIKFLWDHQGKMLDAYVERHLKTADLAIELPTGSGKTLVAMLIAEWRRKKFSERVVFLCPTRQLCAQVATQSAKYGIATALLVGAQRNYDAGQFLAYQQAKRIAVTTYSGLFNTNPKINDPELIICDDAHAAENYVASLWTVSINREEHKEAFFALFRAIQSALPDQVIHAVDMYDSNPYAGSYVDLVSTIALYERHSTMRDVLNGFANEAPKEIDWPYSWREIVDHLDACAVYCSGDTIEIRPVLSPTDTHPPFAQAKQRMYMSATLGEDGDIERTFGVRKISRLPIPPGWDKRGTGRRLVLFPGYGAAAADRDAALLAIFRAVPRSLVLVPDDRSRKAVEEKLDGKFPVLLATNVEQSMEPFTGRADHAILMITNRWEGIDLPGDDCRMMALLGLPAGAGLQERYLLDRLGAFSQLRDRIRTRVTQAMGRCTRDEGDFSVVLMLGDDLLKWCCTQSNTQGIHPEIQAEIDFGLQNSEGRTKEDLLDLIQHFLTQSTDWQEANDSIVQERNATETTKDPTAKVLAAVAPFEIDYVSRLWNGEYDSALKVAASIIAGLEGGQDIRPYRSFWYHQAAVAAFLHFGATNDAMFKDLAIDYLEKASTTSIGIRWLGKLRSKLLSRPVAETESYPVRDWMAEVNKLLTSWGIRGSKYSRAVADVQNALEDVDNPKRFELGLQELGKMLGAVTHRWTDDGAPDGFWLFGDWHAFVFEAKSDEKPSAISLKTVRQAATHEQRARVDKLIPTQVPCSTIVISAHTAVDRSAKPHVGNLCHVSIESIRDLFHRTSTALEDVRIRAATASEELLEQEAENQYRKRLAFMSDVKKLLEASRLSNLS